MSHTPRKRFGQNFLIDERVIHHIVSSISPRSDDHLVEIGPGQGALTRRLLRECAILDALELDRDLVEHLKATFANEENLHIHSADALKFDYSSLAGKGSLRVIGNLPYNISTPLLFYLFDQCIYIKDMHFMLQKEVVDRLCAQAGDKEYGRLGIMASYFCSMVPLLDVYPESFHPQPRVVSTLVRLIPHQQRPVQIGPAKLGRVVMAAFSQRRKTLRNSLTNLFSPGEMESAGINPSERAERLTLADFARLAMLLEEKENH